MAFCHVNCSDNFGFHVLDQQHGNWLI